MARALAFLFAAGAALVGATLALPHEPGTEVPAVLSAVVAAVIVAVALAVAGSRIGPHVIHAGVAAGSLLISQCVAFGGPSADAYAIMYVWVALYACSFFHFWPAVAHIVLVATLYGTVLVLAEDPSAVPHVHWVMAVGTIAVGALLVGRLTRAVRDQAAGLAEVARMAHGLTEVPMFGRAACEGLQRSAAADVVILVEPTDDEDGMEVSAMSGSPEAGLVFDGERAQLAVERAFRSSQPCTIYADEPPRGLRRFDGHVLGLAQPILRDGVTVGVLALAWTRRRRAVPDRASTAALLFAAEASVAIDRAERRSRDREKAALEINDNIVQGLVVAKYLVTSGRVEASVDALDETLGRARRLITDQLVEVSRAGGRIEPGDLARREASSVGETVRPTG